MSIPKNKRSPSSIKNKALERGRGGQKKVRMETTLDAFDDYRDKMNKLANAQEAEAFYLDAVSAECQSVADLIGKTTEVLNDVKDSLIEGLN